MRSLGALCLALAAAAFADKSESSTSTTSSASSIATDLNFVVPEPISAPGVNTSSGCGKELDSDYEPGGDTAGPFTFNTTDVRCCDLSGFDVCFDTLIEGVADDAFRAMVANIPYAYPSTMTSTRPLL